MSATRPRRRRVIVEGFQARFVIVQLVCLAGGLLVFAALLFGPLVFELIGDSDASESVADLFLHLHTSLWPLLLGLFAGLAAILILMTHRVAGPIYRFRLAFRDVSQGRLNVRVRTRQRDYLAEEAAELDAMIGFLSARIGSAQGHIVELEQHLARFSGSTNAAGPNDLGATAATLAALKGDLAVFVVDVDEVRGPSEVAPPGLQTHAIAPSPLQPVEPDRQAGFSLIELLIVSSIIGLLAALAMPAYTSALEAARVARATGDIRTVDREVAMHLVQRGCYPSTLKDIARDHLRDPWGRAFVYGVVIRKGGGGKNGDSCPACDGGCINQGLARKDRHLKPLNFDFDIYSMGRDGESSPPMTAKSSADDVVRANSGGYIGLGRDY